MVSTGTSGRAGKFAPPYWFQPEAPVMRQTEEVGNQTLCVVCVMCVIHVSCLGLTASPPCVKSFPVVVWCAAGLFFIDPRLFCTGTFPLSGLRSLSQIFLHLCCGCVSGGFLPFCFSGGVCSVSSQSCLESVCFTGSRLIVVPPLTGDQRCGLTDFTDPNDS